MRKAFAIGLLSAVLCAGAFAQGVVIDGTGTAQLSWTPPTQYTNGTPIGPDELVGYSIYYGTTSCAGIESEPNADGTSSCYASKFDIDDGTASSSSLTINITGDTTIFFVATARTLSAESVYSNEIAKTLTVTVTAPQPNPPGLIDVAISMTCITNTPGFTCTITTN